MSVLQGNVREKVNLLFCKLVDWSTIPGATISTLRHAYLVDYGKSSLPQRVLLVAGINDLIKGGTIVTVTNSILALKNTIDAQNARNELVVATLLNPPKLTWFPDNGPPPTGHINRLEEISAINKWIIEFNQGYGNATPRFHRFGVKYGRRFVNGATAPLTFHKLDRWRESEPIHDKVHLSDVWRAKLGASVVNHFESEMQNKGELR